MSFTPTLSLISKPDHLPVVNNASWSPLYDLRATSQKGKPSPNVHLHYRANLSQSTGEDWNDAQLTLSTRAPEDLDGGLPKPSTVQIQGVGPKRCVPWSLSHVPTALTSYNTNSPTRPISPGRWIGPRPRPRSRSLTPERWRRPRRLIDRSSSTSRSRSRSRSRSPVMRRCGRSPSRDEDQSLTRRDSPDRRRIGITVVRSRSPARRRRRRGSVTPPELPQYPYHPNETVLITNDVTSVSYIMDGRCSIPGDGKLHKVTIAILPFTGTIHHVVTPRVSSDAYLQVRSPNSCPVFSR